MSPSTVFEHGGKRDNAALQAAARATWPPQPDTRLFRPQRPCRRRRSALVSGERRRMYPAFPLLHPDVHRLITRRAALAVGADGPGLRRLVREGRLLLFRRGV